MSRLDLNRRQFIQLGSAASLMGPMAWHQASATPSVADPSHLGLSTDPHLQLAMAHDFIDHDLQTWPLQMRMVVRWPRSNQDPVSRCLSSGVQVQTRFDVGEQSWATLSLTPQALLRWHEMGMHHLFADHVWGAPWARGSSTHSEMVASGVHKQVGTGVRRETQWGDMIKGSRQRLLVIDHGFPLHHLQASGHGYLHLSSHAANKPDHLARSFSHGAQVVSVLLQHPHESSLVARSPLMLYELPDALLGSMPRGALWPDIIDAVHWGIQHTEPGQELWILLSVVSTDGDRAGDSFITQSARALSSHAMTRQVRLKWIMAAGNNHADHQNLSFEMAPGQSAVWQLHLPAQSAQACFLECWHNAGNGPPRISVAPPGGDWMEAPDELSWAQRTDPSTGKTQTVLRLAATTCLHGVSTTSRAGPWRMRWEADCNPVRLDLHLSMMTASSMGMHRQAMLWIDKSSTATVASSVTLSGLVPHMSDVWVAQTLRPGHEHSWVMTPSMDQLDDHSGRWPVTHALHGVQHVGVRLGPSAVLPGVPVWSRYGQRVYRATGTSMAVPMMVRDGRLKEHV